LGQRRGDPSHALADRVGGLASFRPGVSKVPVY
jgi:hypothetical protein